MDYPGSCCNFCLFVFLHLLKWHKSSHLLRNSPLNGLIPFFASPPTPSLTEKTLFKCVLRIPEYAFLISSVKILSQLHGTIFFLEIGIPPPEVVLSFGLNQCSLIKSKREKHQKAVLKGKSQKFAFQRVVENPGKGRIMQKI